MKGLLNNIIVVLFIIPHISLCQVYKPVVIQDTSIWYFAQKQMAGRNIDTIFAGQKTDNSIEIWYKGAFCNREKTFVGKVRSSLKSDKLWYIPPDDTTEYLIFDLSLEKGEEFDFMNTTYPAKVDTVYYLNGLRVVEFNFYTDWNEPMKFIEGIGPNITIIWAWKDPGILSPFVVCLFEKDVIVYETSNESFIDCNFNTSSIEKSAIWDIQFLPNPFIDQFMIRFNELNSSEIVNISIHTVSGNRIYDDNIYNKGEYYFITKNLAPGIYFITLMKSNNSRTYKLIKQ